MKIKPFILSALLMLPIAAQAQRLDEFSRAVMDAYDTTLAQNPKDYDTYYLRAMAYFQLSQYGKALDDLAKAIEYTPAKNADLLTREYSLMADVYTQTGDYDKALAAADKVLKINPKAYADIYKKGNILMEMGRYEDALPVYRSMLNIKSRSQEAFFGMAQASAKLGKKADAEQYMEEARKVDQSNPLTYCRVGDIYRELGDNPSATVSYLSSITLGGNMNRPVQSLVKIAAADYPGYRQGVRYALDQTGGEPTIHYINSRLAQQAGAYADAEESLKAVMQGDDATDASLLTQLAGIHLALGQLDNAKAEIDAALGAEATTERNLLKSKIEQAMGNYAGALLSASKAYDATSPDVEVLLQMANAAIALADGKSALEALNEAALMDAGNPAIFLMRSYVNGTLLNNAAAARVDMQRAASEPVADFPAVKARAIAMALSGSKDSADALIESALNIAPSAKNLVDAAIYYSQAGDASRSAELILKAKKQGYTNNYVLDIDSTPYLSMKK